MWHSAFAARYGIPTSSRMVMTHPPCIDRPRSIRVILVTTSIYPGDLPTDARAVGQGTKKGPPERAFQLHPRPKGHGESHGAGNRNRTYDLRITNAPLYQLSYSGV